MKRLLALLLTLCLLLPAFPCEASNQLVASGTVTQANMKISAVNGGATASGGAFVDFGAANVLTSKLGNLLVVKDSAGHTIQGWIKAAGSSETLSETELVSNGSMETGTPPTGWTGSNMTAEGDGGTVHGGSQSLKGTRTGAAPLASGNISVASGGLYKGVAWGYHPTAGGASYTLRLDVIAGKNGIDSAVKDSWVDLTNYRVATSTGSVALNLKINSASDGNYGYFDDVSVKQVLTPSATGVTIVSTKGGATYNWSAKDSAFNYNNASGYTYRIYKTPPVLVAGPTAVTAANTQLSMVNPAFAYFVGTDLTAYQTGKHVLAVYNATSGILLGMGYISATPPAGETLATTGGPLNDGELLTNPTFDVNVSDWTPENCTLASIDGGQSNKCMEMTLSSSTSQYANGGGVTSIGGLYKGSAYVKSGTSGNENCALYLRMVSSPYSTWSTLTSASTGSWVKATLYGSALSTSTHIRLAKKTATAGTMLFDEASLRQVVDPPATGARIINAKGTGTQTWLATGAGTLNADINYKIYYVGD